MANRKKQVYKPKPMTEGKRNLIQGLLDILALENLNSGNVETVLIGLMDIYQVQLICQAQSRFTVRSRLYN